MLNELLLLLLPIAAASGWYTARKEYLKSSYKKTNPISRDYFIGLNYLLNEQPDKAVDVFIKMIEVDSETVETHLALGSLFRRRGEVERAIRIHQNLIARPHLSKENRTEALLELGQDYLRAGVFDRAERLFLEVLDMGVQTNASLQHLLNIYQQEKDWEQAIKVAQQLEHAGFTEMNHVIAHYHCEIAESATDNGNEDEAKRFIKRALTTDRQCVRASLLEMQVEINAKHYKAAIRAGKRVKTQDVELLSEALPNIIHCYKQLADEPGLVDYLRECLDDTPKISVVLAFAEHLKESTHSNHAAIEFLAEQIALRPSIRGLKRLIELQLEIVDDLAKESLLVLRGITEQLLKGKPIYRCRHCGFSAKILEWQCPSCKHWYSVKPIQGLEGD